MVSAVSRLKENGMVSQRHYGKVFLSRSGKARAEEIYRAHKTLKLFLTRILRLPPEISEKEACRMEHGISKETLKRLIDFVENILGDSQGPNGDSNRYINEN